MIFENKKGESSATFLPTDMVNKILVYVGELNHAVVIKQYDPKTLRERYKINRYSDFLWKLKSTLWMKRLYPIRKGYFTDADKEMYQEALKHYERELRMNNIKGQKWVC